MPDGIEGSPPGAYLAVDWGTTNRRVFVVGADGRTLDAARDDRGVLRVARGEYPGEIARLRDRHGDLPVFAAGMVGSTIGWREIPYVDAPADAAALARAAGTIDGGVVIVPGIALRGDRTDVMRGEEVQALGATAVGAAPADALFCQPGTHNKWIETRGGRITSFATAMTGEVFSLLRGGGVLRGMLDGPVVAGPAFKAGVDRGMRAADLLVALFETRSAVLLGERPAVDAAAFVSGVLIGSDVGTRADIAGRDVHLLADGPLGPLYGIAIEAAGGRPILVDARSAFVAGIHAIREHLT